MWVVVSDKDAWIVVPIRILTRLVVQTCRVYQLSVPTRLPHWSYIMYDKIILRCLLQWYHKWFNSAVWTWPQLTIKKGWDDLLKHLPSYMYVGTVYQLHWTDRNEFSQAVRRNRCFFTFTCNSHQWIGQKKNKDSATCMTCNPHIPFGAWMNVLASVHTIMSIIYCYMNFKFSEEMSPLF